MPSASPNQDNSVLNALTLLHAAHLRALCRRLAAAALLGACAAPARIVTAPSAESCPAGYQFLYTDHLANDSSRAVCGR